MSYIVVDVEADGNLIGTNSMVCFGAVIIDKEGKLDKTFYGETVPISDIYNPEALSVSGFSRSEHLEFDEPHLVMQDFKEWIEENSKGKPILISDNNGFDASWINWYFIKYIGENPFGWSSRRIGDMFAGFMNSSHYKWKKHRITRHTHNPIDDCMGNAEALLWLRDQGYNIKF